MNEVAGELIETAPDNPGRNRIRPSLWPETDFVNVGVRGDASELEGLTAADYYRGSVDS